METMQLLPITKSADLTQLDDASIEALFMEAGIVVDVIEHCDAAVCEACFPSAPAQAA